MGDPISSDPSAVAPTDPAPPFGIGASPWLRFVEVSAILSGIEEGLRGEWFARIARAFAGLGAAGPRERRDAWADVVGLGESEAFRADMAPDHDVSREPGGGWHRSSCGLVCRRVWACAGVAGDALQPPYHPGMVMADLERIARAAGAWEAPGTVWHALPGDVLVYAPQHVETVVDLTPDGSPIVVAGGQAGGYGGGTECREVVRAFRGLTTGTHTLRGIIRCARLPIARGVLLPERVDQMSASSTASEPANGST